jgi:FkbM family methyltransferase
MSAVSGEAVFDRIQQTNQLIAELEPILQSLMLNDSTMIDGLAQMLGTMQHMQHHLEALVGNLAADVRELSGRLHERSITPAMRDKAAIPGFDLDEPEIGLLAHLLPLLPNPVALDIGANTGRFAHELVEAGFEVFAFEPFSASHAALQRQAADSGGRLHAFPFAVGAQDGAAQLLVATDISGTGKYDTSLFHSTIRHPMLEDVDFTGAETVPMRALASLVADGTIPAAASLLKIDTEGADLEVIKGAGNIQIPLVLMEFWDREHPFGRGGHGDLASTVREMRARGYPWHVVLHRVDETGERGYFANIRTPASKSWGNVLFFNDFKLFGAASAWCSLAYAPAV